jgi:hypothetical protein
MKSEVALEAERELIRATQRLTPEQRIDAFLAHCRLVMELHQAGKDRRMRDSGQQSTS